MKKCKKSLFVAVAVMMMFLTGCGSGLYELTAEEETLIIHSAAYFVAKHNIQQKDGANGYPLPEEFDEDESESESESESETESETESENVGDGGSGEGTEAPSNPPKDEITLAELIGHKEDLTVTYEGSQVTKTYQEGSAYLVDAEKGKTFYVMKFKLTNVTDEDVVVDNAQKSPIVKLISDVVKVKSEVTFLSTDFSTYQGTIAAGESVETILLFEVSESVADQIKEPALEITIEKTTKTIKL